MEPFGASIGGLGTNRDVSWGLWCELMEPFGENGHKIDANWAKMGASCGLRWLCWAQLGRSWEDLGSIYRSFFNDL